MRRGAVQRSGEVTVRHAGASTQTRVVRGKLVDALDDIAARLGVRATGAQLVDEHGLCVTGALAPGGVYYIECDDDVDVGSSSMLAPDARVLWAYDERMARLHDPGDVRTPETPYRLQCIMHALRECPRAHQLLPRELRRSTTTATTTTMMHDDDMAYLLPARLATRDEVLAWHDAVVYGDFVDHGARLAASALPSDVYCTDSSSTAARLAAGAVIDAAQAVWRGVQRARVQDKVAGATRDALLALCLVRPPGHHCMRGAPGGFCLLNNVALATQALRRATSGTAERIAIVDLDVHFGDGTAAYVEDAVRDDDDNGAASAALLYVSLHRYDGGSFYPRDVRAATTYTGHGACICNAAVDTHAHEAARCTAVISDHVMDAVLTRVVVPRLARFAPDIVLVSLGLDAAYGDPLGKQAVEGGYARAMRTLKQWCLHDAPHAPVGLVAALEGGYNAAAVAQCVLGVAHALALPHDDADVQRYCALQTPRTWRDVRARQQREVVAACSDDDSSARQTHVADDATLLRQHLQWCDALVDHACAVHHIV